MRAHHITDAERAHAGFGQHQRARRREGAEPGGHADRGRGHGFGPGRMPFLGRHRPTRRGEIRAAILVLLEESPMHGYQVITELSERSGGDWRPSAGSVYPTLQQLTDEGLVRDEEREGRRVYELTDSGRAEVERTRSQVPPWQATDRSDAPDLRRVAIQVMSATMQVSRDGDAPMQARAYELLVECRRSLYRLLADDDAAAGEG
jgi:DNA-binding PadR family transcriptional regulator